jgi:hypothetical protein
MVTTVHDSITIYGLQYDQYDDAAYSNEPIHMESLFLKYIYGPIAGTQILQGGQNI